MSLLTPCDYSIMSIMHTFVLCVFSILIIPNKGSVKNSVLNLEVAKIANTANGAAQEAVTFALKNDGKNINITSTWHS